MMVWREENSQIRRGGMTGQSRGDLLCCYVDDPRREISPKEQKSDHLTSVGGVARTSVF